MRRNPKQLRGRRGGDVERITTSANALNTFGEGFADFVNKFCMFPIGAPRPRDDDLGMQRGAFAWGRRAVWGRHANPWLYGTACGIRAVWRAVWGRPRSYKRTEGGRRSHPGTLGALRGAEPEDTCQPVQAKLRVELFPERRTG